MTNPPDVRKAEIRRVLSEIIPGLRGIDQSENSSRDDLVDRVLAWLDITQAQMAALLAVSPQAISKGLREDGLDYLAKDNKAKPLHQTLAQIGGDRYSVAASRLKEIGLALGWGNVESNAEEILPPQDLYAFAEEIWILADNPATVLNWEALRSQIMSPARPNLEKILVFFFRSLEGAERWAEVLEREFARDAICDGRLDPERTAVANCYLYVIVTNTLAFSQDYVIADPGSRCMGVDTTARFPSAYFWSGNGYCKIASPNLDFIRVAQGIGLGTASQKVNFFPRGMPLRPDVLDFKHAFLDALIAVRGPTADEDATESGENLAGGIFRSVMARPAQTAAFNKRTKLVPVFLLTYKRRPGDGMNKNPNRTIRILQDELDRNVEARLELDVRLHQCPNFW